MNDLNYCIKYQVERIHYVTNAISRRILKKDIIEQKYCKEVLLPSEGNSKIADLIRAGKPCMIARFGGNEIRVVSDVLYENIGGKLGGLSKRSCYKIVNQAGFFPNDKKEIKKLGDLYLDCCKEVDFIGVWNMFLYGEITKRYLPDAIYADLSAIEPFYYDNPWSKYLKGKRILVVHPFSDTIQSQYSRRDVIFSNKDILPEFTLRTVKAVQTIAGASDSRFNNWFEALDYMYEECMREDFDIALVGCGAYGFPLSARLKRSGKQVVHMGGGLQLLFGIKGNRWDNDPVISKLYNEYWVRPSDIDRVENSSVVEGSCYW